MKVYVCTDFNGVWPVGTSAIVIAEDARKARVLLDIELANRGLTQNKPFTLTEVSTTQAVALVLQDGDY